MGMFSHDEMEQYRDAQAQQCERDLQIAKQVIKEMDLIIRDATEVDGNEPFWDKYQKDIYPRVEALGL